MQGYTRHCKLFLGQKQLVAVHKRGCAKIIGGSGAELEDAKMCSDASPQLAKTVLDSVGLLETPHAKWGHRSRTWIQKSVLFFKAM